jgi:hypothetical protein
MNASKLATVFGIVFIAIGILGFVPGITTADGRLLGIFQVDAIHNVVHLLSGIVALLMAAKAPKTYFKVFGIVYLLVTILGFVQQDTILGLFTINMADNILHLVIAATALYIGFGKDNTVQA